MYYKFCRLLNHAFTSEVSLPNSEVLLNNEISWLKKVRVCIEI